MGVVHTGSKFSVKRSRSGREVRILPHFFVLGALVDDFLFENFVAVTCTARARRSKCTTWRACAHHAACGFFDRLGRQKFLVFFTLFSRLWKNTPKLDQSFVFKDKRMIKSKGDIASE